jgi:hypothetical protein
MAEQFVGIVHLPDAGPAALEVLQFPNTASSGRRRTRDHVGRRYSLLLVPSSCERCVCWLIKTFSG